MESHQQNVRGTHLQISAMTLKAPATASYGTEQLVPCRLPISATRDYSLQERSLGEHHSFLVVGHHIRTVEYQLDDSLHSSLVLACRIAPHTDHQLCTGHRQEYTGQRQKRTGHRQEMRNRGQVVGHQLVFRELHRTLAVAHMTHTDHVMGWPVEALLGALLQAATAPSALEGRFAREVRPLVWHGQMDPVKVAF